eukprot:COSAG03_NODE_1913_length_3363_cov_1017.109069_2_plen_55_part_00
MVHRTLEYVHTRRGSANSHAGTLNHGHTEPGVQLAANYVYEKCTTPPFHKYPYH